jgi:hypothetical protein
MAYLNRRYGHHGYRENFSLIEAVIDVVSPTSDRECGECLRDLDLDGPYTIVVTPGIPPSNDIYVAVFCLDCAPNAASRTKQALEVLA